MCSIFTSLLALVEAGDEVLIPDPGWPNYMMQMGCIGAKGVRYPLDPDHGFQLKFDAIEKLVTPRTKVLLINTPGNPTGAVFPEDAVKEICAFARRHDLFVLSDEVYEEILFDGVHTSTGKFDTDGRVATVFGFSKTYAVTGLRSATPFPITRSSSSLSPSSRNRSSLRERYLAEGVPRRPPGAAETL